MQSSMYRDKVTMKPLIVLCPYCGQPATLVDSEYVYGVSYGSKLWRCDPCDAHVGVHKNSERFKPLGTLAD